MNQRRTKPHPSESAKQTPPPDAQLYGKPEYELPTVARDITALSDDDLMSLFVELVGWQNYANELLVEKEMDEKEAEARISFLKTQAMVNDWDTNKKTATQLKAEVEQTEEMQEAMNALHQVQAERKYTKMIYDNTERSAALVSRELSRRIGRDGVERRSMRWTP